MKNKTNELALYIVHDLPYNDFMVNGRTDLYQNEYNIPLSNLEYAQILQDYYDLHITELDFDNNKIIVNNKQEYYLYKLPNEDLSEFERDWYVIDEPCVYGVLQEILDYLQLAQKHNEKEIK